MNPNYDKRHGSKHKALFAGTGAVGRRQSGKSSARVDERQSPRKSEVKQICVYLVRLKGQHHPAGHPAHCNCKESTLKTALLKKNKIKYNMFFPPAVEELWVGPKADHISNSTTSGKKRKIFPAACLRTGNWAEKVQLHK